MPAHQHVQPVYLPPNEIISSTENFVSLYEEYHIAFEKIYYDLVKLLNRPLKKQADTAVPHQVAEKIQSFLGGDVVRKDKKFFLSTHKTGDLEICFLPEGYRKLCTILYLISSGSLNENSVLFWDEPESNMDQKTLGFVVDLIKDLARMDIQIFLTTHNHFVQQAFASNENQISLTQPSAETCFLSLP